MKIFISAGEPSGDLHGSNLMHALRQHQPDARFVGFGGDRMAAGGADLLFPLTQYPIMGFTQALAHVPFFLNLLSKTNRYLRNHRPDAVVLIDYPGFNWWVARRAKAHGIPVFYFVPPQIWAWASWRVKKMQRFVDQVLCTLPFEKTWYEERQVQAHFVGHPFFDELRQQQLDPQFLAEQRHRGEEIVALLPGSRTKEVENNLSSLIRSAQVIHAARPSARFLVASFKPHQKAMVDSYLANHPKLPIETHVGRTPEIIELAKACLSVSGSVSLELLYRLVPSAIVYRINAFDMRLVNFFKKSPYICLVNLLANREIYPEFLTVECQAQAMAGRILQWLENPAKADEVRQELRTIRDQVAAPGACDRAAELMLQTLARKRQSRAA